MAGPILMDFRLLILRTLNKGTNSLINEQIRVRRMACRALLHNEHHKICNGWYSGMVAPIYSIVGILILYSRSVITER